MTQRTIIDSHVHFWPRETSNEAGHAWMTADNPLAKPHLLADYQQALESDAPQLNDVSRNGVIRGLVYIETDVRHLEPIGDVTHWAKRPLDEIVFLRSMVESRGDEHDTSILRGLVPWAPMDQPTDVLRQYLDHAKLCAGATTWSRVKGFRFLLQAISEETAFQELVLSSTFIANLKLLGELGLAFDVGVDQNSGGTFQLKYIVQAMLRAHEGVPEQRRVTYILNHLCKPDFRQPSGDAFEAWRSAMSSMSKLSKTFIKLSGAFSELPDGTCATAQDVANHIRPWFRHLLQHFGAERILFGSDWPVCNVKGIEGENSWRAWESVVRLLLDDDEVGLFEAQKDRVWSGTAIEAYGLD